MTDQEMISTPHGFILLMTGGDEQRQQYQRAVYEAIRQAGFAPWNSVPTGFPLFVVLDGNATKAQWFEAGFWAGARVPLFGFGRGQQFRTRHRDIVARLGGWLVQTATPADLILAIGHRGIQPSTWDRSQVVLPAGGAVG